MEKKNNSLMLKDSVRDAIRADWETQKAFLNSLATMSPTARMKLANRLKVAIEELKKL